MWELVSRTGYTADSQPPKLAQAEIAGSIGEQQVGLDPACHLGSPPEGLGPGYVPECHVDLGWEGGGLSKGYKNLEI